MSRNAKRRPEEKGRTLRLTMGDKGNIKKNVAIAKVIASTFNLSQIRKALEIREGKKKRVGPRSKLQKLYTEINKRASAKYKADIRAGKIGKKDGKWDSYREEEKQKMMQDPRWAEAVEESKRRKEERYFSK
jgi:hypothetical protein